MQGSTLSPTIELLESRRLLSAGDLDTTFGGDGKVTTELGTSERANQVLVQSDGKIVVAGAGNGDARLVRYNANGTLDTAFSGDGIASLSWGGTESFADAVLLPDGRIVVAGNSNGGWWLARFKSNGTLDTNSGFGGADAIANGGGGRVGELELQGTNLITADAAGNVRRHSGSTGAVDTTFGSGGTVNVGAATGMTSFALADLAIAPGGKIVVAGTAFPGEESNDVDAYAVARLNPNGAADSTFAGDGSFVSDFIGGGGGAAGVIAQPDGKLVTIAQEEDADAGIVRLNANGTPDTSFGAGQDGRYGHGSTVLIGYPAPTGPLTPDLALQSDGKILVSGWQEIGTEFSSDFVVQRFTSSGLADSTFSRDSLASVNFGGAPDDSARAIAMAPDGKIVLAGETGEPGTPLQLAVARLEGGDDTRPAPAYIKDRVVYVDGTAGNDTIVTGGHPSFGGELTVVLNEDRFTFDESDFDRVEVRGFAGNDSLDDRSAYPTLFLGGDGNDFVRTFSEEGYLNASVVGGAGDDVVHFGPSSGGLTPFDGGAGRDRIELSPVGTLDLDLRDYPTVEDAVMWGVGDLTGNALNNHLTHNDIGRVDGGDGNDTLVSGAFSTSVHLFGENGSDVLIGSGSGDSEFPSTLDGGAGNDTLRPGTGAELLKGGAGLDTLDYAARTANLSITLGTTANDGAAGEGDNASFDIETVNGGSGNDFISATGSNNVLRGNGGNDLLRSFGGNDALFGGAGNDRLEAGTGNDYLEGNSGNDALLGESGTDYYLGHDGDDWLYSRDGVSETVNGGDGFDRAQRDASDNVLSIEAFLA